MTPSNVGDPLRLSRYSANGWYESYTNEEARALIWKSTKLRMAGQILPGISTEKLLGHSHGYYAIGLQAKASYETVKSDRNTNTRWQH